MNWLSERREKVCFFYALFLRFFFETRHHRSNEAPKAEEVVFKGASQASLVLRRANLYGVGSSFCFDSYFFTSNIVIIPVIFPWLSTT